MATLSEGIQQKLKADQEAVSQQTRRLLGQHEKDLQKLCKAALITTENSIDEIQSMTASRLRWLMLWPLLATVVVCVLMILCTAVYSMWIVSDAQARVRAAEKNIDRLNETFCASPAGKAYCTRR